MKTPEVETQQKETPEVETSEVVPAVVRPDVEGYVKSTSANGSSTLHNGDTVATGLASLTLGETFAVASKLLGLTVESLANKYGHLNLGMQRMNLGNRIRGAIALIDKGNAKEIAKVEKANAKLINGHNKAIAQALATHNKVVAKIEKANAVEGAEQVELPTLAEIEAPVLAEVPEQVEGKGVEAFNEAIAEFKDAIDQRAVETELAVKAKQEAKEKAEADKKAKAEEKAEKKLLADEAKAKAKAKAKAEKKLLADEAE